MWRGAQNYFQEEYIVQVVDKRRMIEEDIVQAADKWRMIAGYFLEVGNDQIGIAGKD